MALRERTVINKAEILASGDIQVRQANETYDDTTPDEVRSSAYHRYVVLSEDDTPAAVQAFLDNSKAS